MKESEIARILIAKCGKTATRNQEALLEEWMNSSTANRIFVEKEYFARAEKNHVFTLTQKKIREEFKKLFQALYQQQVKDEKTPLNILHMSEIARLIVLELTQNISPVEKARLDRWMSSDQANKIMYELLVEKDQKRIVNFIAQFLFARELMAVSPFHKTIDGRHYLVSHTD